MLWIHDLSQSSGRRFPLIDCAPIRYPPTANRLLRHRHHLPLRPEMVAKLTHVDALHGRVTVDGE